MSSFCFDITSDNFNHAVVAFTSVLGVTFFFPTESCACSLAILPCCSVIRLFIVVKYWLVDIFIFLNSLSKNNYLEAANKVSNISCDTLIICAAA